jgi:peroxiredoxin
LMAGMNIQHITHSDSAPDFELLSVKGERISLSQYRGKVVLLNFWATW